MSKIEMGKQYKTRSGLPVRVLTTDREGTSMGSKWPVVALVMLPTGSETVLIYQEDGLLNKSVALESSYDLIEVKPRIKREYWLNIYLDKKANYLYPSKETADNGADSSRVACVPIIIDCEENEGLT